MLLSTTPPTLPTVGVDPILNPACALWLSPGCVQAILEFHCCAPPAPPGAGGTGLLLRWFRGFWDSGAPRLGQPKAGGWAAWCLGPVAAGGLGSVGAASGGAGASAAAGLPAGAAGSLAGAAAAAAAAGATASEVATVEPPPEEPQEVRLDAWDVLGPSNPLLLPLQHSRMV